MKDTGISLEDYERILAEADPGGNFDPTQDELGEWLNVALENGTVTEEQAQALWKSQWHAENSKTFDDWRGKTAEKEALMKELEAAGITEEQYQSFLEDANVDGNSLTQAEADEYLTNEIEAGNLTEEQASILWDSKGWEKSRETYRADAEKKQINQAADADGNKSVSQDELGTYLQTEIAAGRMSRDRAEEIWNSKKWKTSFSEWSGTGNPEAAAKPKAKEDKKVTDLESFKKYVPIYSDNIETAYNLYQTEVKPLGISLQKYSQIVMDANTDGKNTATQDEMGNYLVKQVQARKITQEQADAIWHTIWSGKRSKTFQDWLQENYTETKALGDNKLHFDVNTKEWDSRINENEWVNASSRQKLKMLTNLSVRGNFDLNRAVETAKEELQALQKSKAWSVLTKSGGETITQNRNRSTGTPKAHGFVSRTRNVTGTAAPISASKPAKDAYYAWVDDDVDTALDYLHQEYLKIDEYGGTSTQEGRDQEAKYLAESCYVYAAKIVQSYNNLNGMIAAQEEQQRTLEADLKKLDQIKQNPKSASDEEIEWMRATLEIDYRDALKQAGLIWEEAADLQEYEIALRDDAKAFKELYGGEKEWWEVLGIDPRFINTRK